MKKMIYKLFFVASLLLVSCNEEDALITDQLSGGVEAVGFKESSVNIAYFQDLGPITYNIPVEIKALGDGQLPTNDIQVSYTISNGTAQEGVEFTNPSTTNVVVLPAGSTFVNIPIVVNTGSLNATQATEAYINLSTSTPNTVISETNKKATVKFIGCATSLQGTYKYGSTVATITKIAPNKYRSTYLPTFASAYWFEFTDTCGELQITDWQYQGGNKMYVTGDENALPKGVILPNGDLKFEHVNVTGVSWYVDRTWTLVKQ